MEIYEERLRQKNALIAQIVFQNKLNAEDLKNYQKIIKDQQNEIRKLYDELRTKGNGMRPSFQLRDPWTMHLWTGHRADLLRVKN